MIKHAFTESSKLKLNIDLGSIASHVSWEERQRILLNYPVEDFKKSCLINPLHLMENIYLQPLNLCVFKTFI